jgi:hypothetical protein
VKELLSPQDLTQASITKDATHLYVNFIDDHGIDHTIKIPLLNSKPNASFNTQTKPQSSKPSIVRIDRTETGQQIERRSNRNNHSNHSNDYIPFSRKLTESQVREIKALLDDKDYMREFKSEYKAHKELGDVYNVNYMTIAMIARGMTWKHITN